ncbi:transketolase family protein [Candidatus Peregrinibacteria bacterium]|nr:transketolase family protein [Candidatus Peregrinibacteria bacterium]
MIKLNNIEDLSYVERAFAESVLKLGKKYPNIVILNTGCSGNIAAEKFSKFFEYRCFNLGMAEENIASCAAGFSVRGKVPFITGKALLLVGKAWEQVCNGICYPNLNVKIVGTHSGLSASGEGVISQAISDIALMRSLPNMSVVCPADYRETLSVFGNVMENFGPTYIRLFEGEIPDIYDKEYSFEFGKASLLKEGRDICIFATGKMVSESLKSVEILEEKGISAMVVNVSSIKPIDEELIVKCGENKKLCFSVEDHNIMGGLGSAVMEVLGEKNPVPLVRIGLNDQFGEGARPKDLYKKYGLDYKGITEKILNALGY